VNGSEGEEADLEQNTPDCRQQFRKSDTNIPNLISSVKSLTAKRVKGIATADFRINRPEIISLSILRAINPGMLEFSPQPIVLIEFSNLGD
jgi:hypothetical protein